MVKIAGAFILLLGILPFDALAASPTLSSSRAHLRTQGDGDVEVLVSTIINDADGIDGIAVSVERVGEFGPFPMEKGFNRSPSDTATRDGFSVGLDANYVAHADRGGDYTITADDGGAPISTTVSLAGGLTPLAPGGPTNIDTSTGLLTPTVSIAPVPGATHYRVLIFNDSETISRTYDGVSGGLSPTSSIVLGAGIMEAGKFYRFRINGYDASTLSSASRRSDSEDVCYDPATGFSNPPCFPQRDVHMVTRADGDVRTNIISRVLELDELDTLESVTIARPGVFGPFDLTTNLLRDVDIDSNITDRFTDQLNSNEVSEAQRAGDYVFTASDGISTVSVTRVFPSGLTPLPVAGPVTIDTSSGLLTPTISIPPVPGATHYRAVVFNDTDSTRAHRDDTPSSILSPDPVVTLFDDGTLEAGKAYRIRMEAHNASTFVTTTVRNQSAFVVYDPSGLDLDGDGIQNDIDGQFAGGFNDESAVASANFTNEHLGGIVSGSIVDTQDVHVTVATPSNPASAVNLGAAGGTGTAMVEACGQDFLLTNGDAAIANCGSLIMEILAGLVEFPLGDNSMVAAPGGAIIKISEPTPGQYMVENSEGSLVPITVETAGETTTVEPGDPDFAIIDVRIDIRPWLPNTIRLRSRRSVKVAILSDDNFSATSEIDRSTLTFGRTGLEASARWCWRWDVNWDRRRDLICSFPIRDTGFELGDTTGVLKGKTWAGELIQGTDDVRIR